MKIMCVPGLTWIEIWRRQKRRLTYSPPTLTLRLDLLASTKWYLILLPHPITQLDNCCTLVDTVALPPRLLKQRAPPPSLKSWVKEAPLYEIITLLAPYKTERMDSGLYLPNLVYLAWRKLGLRVVLRPLLLRRWYWLPTPWSYQVVWKASSIFLHKYTHSQMIKILLFCELVYLCSAWMSSSFLPCPIHYWIPISTIVYW